MADSPWTTDPKYSFGGDFEARQFAPDPKRMSAYANPFQQQTVNNQTFFNQGNTRPSGYNPYQAGGNTPFLQYYLNETPDAAYARHVQQYGGNQNFQNYAWNKSGQTYKNYEGQLADEPNLMYPEYLSRQNNLYDEWLGQSARNRGENPGMYVNRLRWVGF